MALAARWTKDKLEEAVLDGRIDTIMAGFVDMQGRIVGKRIPADYFLEEVAHDGMHFCKYLLGTDMEMGTPDGYELMNWEEGYGDWVAVPDFATLRPLPWLPGTAMILADVVDPWGVPVEVAPRRILQTQIERARRLGFEPIMATELEFYLWKETYESAHHKGYRDMEPSGWYFEDYHFLQSTKAEPFYREVRNLMRQAAIPVISGKGEAGPGQYEINMAHGPALEAADNHAIYKHGIKEMAIAHDLAVTFMAKPDHQVTGSSCHVHVSLVDRQTGANVFAGGSSDGRSLSEMGRWFLAGQLALSREWTLLLAPTVNSYKRYAAASWAPINIAWAYDNRTCGLRVVGHDSGLHIESRLPGADANPYMTLAAILGAGLWGIEHRANCPEEFHGNAYEAKDLPHVPRGLGEAARLFRHSEAASQCFGDQVVSHYVHAAEVEQADYDKIVTQWEKERYFERI